jgi:uncharacterized Fe-S cluster-containing radical SAM superfamily protein
MIPLRIAVNTGLHFLKNRAPGQLVIQLTDQCNAHCPQCGMRVTEKFGRATIAADTAKRIIDSAAKKGIQAVSFTGGEPFLELELLLELIDYAGHAGIRFIRTGTNGFFFRYLGGVHFEDRIKKIADCLAKTQLRNLWISIDSADPALHESLRGLSGVIQGIEKALPIFHERGIYPSANMGINRAIGGGAVLSLKNDDTFQERNERAFYETSRNAFHAYYSFIINSGFSMVNACYPMCTGGSDPSLKSVYAADSAASLVNFIDREKGLIFKALMDTIPAFRGRIRIFSPMTSLYSLWNRYYNNVESSYPCRGGIDFFFIDAKEHSTYPCGYRGSEKLGKFWDLDMSKPFNAHCRKCDWECFKDPSELLGPLFHVFTSPIGYLQKIFKDPKVFQLWINDLLYYRACGFFNGRKPSDFSEMLKFRPKKKNLIKS